MPPSCSLFAFLCAWVALAAGCAAPANKPYEYEPAAQQPALSVPGSRTDYLVLAPRAYADELAPLLAMRKAQGHVPDLRAVEDIYAARSGGVPSSEALAAEIQGLLAVRPSALRYIVLAGDPQSGPALVPSFMAEVGDWKPYGFDVRSHRTDHGYAFFGQQPLAVGRLPARTEREMSEIVHKLVTYEASASAGAWQRRVNVFGGPADFGPVADGMLESQATTLLDELLPYDYDVGVVFAKADSPWAFRFDRLGEKLVSQLNEGSLLTVYAGHGNEDAFDRARYRGKRYAIGSTKELEALNIEQGSPIFVSLTCLTGDYGRTSGERSIAETMILHPRGPIAVFAASDVSHPYPNLLYAQALLDSFLVQRHATLGAGIVAAKLSMLDRSIPLASLLVPGDLEAIKKEHLTLYNLLGDPATHVRLPLHATVSLPETQVKPGAPLRVSVTSEGLGEASLLATVETERSALKPGLISSGTIEKMPLETAFETMAKNHAIAMDKILSRKESKFVGPTMSLDVVAPEAAGRYVVKVLLRGEGGRVAAGHVRFEVR